MSTPGSARLPSTPGSVPSTPGSPGSGIFSLSDELPMSPLIIPSRDSKTPMAPQGLLLLSRAETSPNFKLDMDSYFDDDRKHAVLGREFAKTVSSRAIKSRKISKLNLTAGELLARNAAKKEAKKSEYPPMKPFFIDDTKNTPAMLNTHVCNEYDAHYGNVNKVKLYTYIK